MGFPTAKSIALNPQIGPITLIKVSYSSSLGYDTTFPQFLTILAFSVFLLYSETEVKRMTFYWSNI